VQYCSGSLILPVPLWVGALPRLPTHRGNRVGKGGRETPQGREVHVDEEAGSAGVA